MSDHLRLCLPDRPGWAGKVRLRATEGDGVSSSLELQTSTMYGPFKGIDSRRYSAKKKNTGIDWYMNEKRVINHNVVKGRVNGITGF